MFKKGTLKIRTYKDITVDIQLVWNAKIKVILVITGATGTIAVSFRQYLSDIRGENPFKS